MSAVELDLTTRRALALAAEDAHGRGHRHLGTGHLLMGVLGTPDGAGARVLGQLGVTLHDVDAEIVRVAGYGVAAPGNGCTPPAVDHEGAPGETRAGGAQPADHGRGAGTAGDSGVPGAVEPPGTDDAHHEDVFGAPSVHVGRRWFRRRAPLPMSVCAEDALRRAVAESGGAVDTDHLVLGLLDCPDGLARRILTATGVTPHRLRSALQPAPPP